VKQIQTSNAPIAHPPTAHQTPGHEALPPDPRDPDLVRAKALARTGLLATKARCRYG
jgi:hypothetical protein